MKKYADIAVYFTVSFEDDGDADLHTQAIEEAADMLDCEACIEVIGPVRDTETSEAPDVCQTCNGTGKEGRHSICRDCDEITSTQNPVAFNVAIEGWGEELLYSEDGAKSLVTRLRRTKGIEGEVTITPLYANPPLTPFFGGCENPVAHLVWRQAYNGIDDVHDYFEVAGPGEKSVDGTEPFPVWASPPPPTPRAEVQP